MLRQALRSGLFRFLKSKPHWSTRLLWILKEARPDIPIVLDYAVRSQPRYDVTHPHPRLYAMMAGRTDVYATHLGRFLELKNDLLRIPRSAPEGVAQASWLNEFQPPLDALALYCFVALTNPRLYLEVGSGFSTSLVRRAIGDHQLRTKILSIDPQPRAEIDSICDTVIRSPLETCDLGVFDQLQDGDILFIDSSHRCFMNSDATVLFLEVLPSLRPGVLVQVHDIFLPYDYPEGWVDRYYGEQYLLACYLLAGGCNLEIVLPNCFVTNHPDLRTILAPLWAEDVMHGIAARGWGFWARTK